MKKTIAIAMVTALLVTLMSVFAAAAASITITVTTPSVGEPIQSVKVTANGNSYWPMGCFDYDTYYSTFKNFENNGNFSQDMYSYVGVDGTDIKETDCVANTKYIAVFLIINDESTFSDGTILNVATGEESGILYIGTNELCCYMVFTPAGNSDSNQDVTNPGDTASGSTTPDDTPADNGNNSTTNTVTPSFKDVVVTYQEAEEPLTIYKVDIVFGSMEFTYTEESKGTWNTSTHQYENPEESSWSCAQGANVITITNHSNAAVNVSLSYDAKEAFSSVTGSFSKSMLSLETAEEKLPANAPSATVNLSLSGTIDEPFTGESTCGTVTVTIN